MAGNITEFTDENFDAEVLRSPVPVIVDFWAEWCQPCLAIAPAVEEVANANAGKVKFGKVNVDNSPAVASRYGVRSIPTLLLFKGGQVAEKTVGAVPKDAIQALVDKAQ
jgi:thioredoxin 1